MRKLERGSTELVVIGLLVVALLGAVGYIAWGKINTKQDSSGTQSFSTQQSIASAKTYCLTIEKLCFDYPSDWRVVTKNPPETISEGPSTESIVVQNASGKDWLSIISGVTGFDTGVGPDGGRMKTEIVAAHPTKLSDPRYVKEDIASLLQPTQYVISYVANDTVDNTYFVGMELSNNKKAISPSIHQDDSDFFLSTSIPRKSTDTSSIIVGTTTLGSDIQPFEQPYRSDAAAKAALKSPDAQQVFTILKSLRYQ